MGDEEVGSCWLLVTDRRLLGPAEEKHLGLKNLNPKGLGGFRNRWGRQSYWLRDGEDRYWAGPILSVSGSVEFGNGGTP